MKSLIASIAVCGLLSLAFPCAAQKGNRKTKIPKRQEKVEEQNVRLTQANGRDSVPMQSTFKPELKKKKKVAIVPMPPTPPPLGPPQIPPKTQP